MVHKNIYIIADLHLNHNNPEVANIFHRFLMSISNNKNILFILGDFFDYWIGDDHADDFYHKITDFLNQASNQGLEIFFMHGNRDFLISKKFAKQSGVKIINDPYYINIADKNIILAHGDLMCTDDKSYQFYRILVRNRVLQFIFMRLPLSFRQRLARKARNHSYSKNTQNPNIDVTSKGIQKYRKNCNTVIHGHTHKMAIHNEKNFIRYVLGDWFKTGNYIKISSNGKITQIKELS